MKALTAAEMREVDRLTTERYGVPSLQLMETAGKQVADVIGARIVGLPPQRIAVLCGKGNNGGDGFVAARYLREFASKIKVYLFASPEELRGDAAINFMRWRDAEGGVTVIRDEASWNTASQEVAGAGIVVDALLGTGLRGPATGLMAQAIENVNRFSQNATAAKPGLIVAVDTPSGLPSDGEPAPGPVLHAHVTVTFTAPKIGQLISREAAHCGQLIVRSIGSPEALIEEVGHESLRWLGPEEFAGMRLVRAADSHKGSFGHALLVAGSLGKSGAAVLAGRAALRAGAGLVTIATPDVVLPAVAAGQPEYMTEPLTSTSTGTIALSNLSDSRFSTLLEGKTVLAVGPGLGTHPETQQFIREFIQQTSLPVVLDADGLNAFAQFPDVLSRRKSAFLCVTPHPGEMARLLGSSSASVQQDRVKTAVETARRWNCYVVLKGFHTVLASPAENIFVNTTGNPALAKGGSGDVLTGLLAGLTAQAGSQDWLRVLGLGVYLHGAASDTIGSSEDPSGLIAGELASRSPRARAQLLQELRQRG